MQPEFRKFSFRDYLHDSNKCGVKIVTPDGGHYMHTFFDVNPISPSGRFLACLKLPFDSRLPGWDDTAEVCVIDLREQTVASLYRTKGWGLCVGAHVCWGAGDTLYFNDKEADAAFGVEYRLRDHSFRRLNGAVYQVTRDGKYAFSPNLVTVNHVQKGYGVAIDEQKYSAEPSAEMDGQDGLWRLNIETNTKELIFSKKAAFDLLPDKSPFKDCTMVFFHTKISPDQKRIMQVIRCTVPHKMDRTGRSGQLRYIVTMDLDGKNPCIALPYEFWADHSHHPHWCPDSKHITMNLNLNGVLRFYRFKQNGNGLGILFPHLLGSGHPSFSSDMRFLLTDTYTDEPFANRNGEVPIRLIDMPDGIEKRICYIWTLPPDTPFDLRCDPHPVWSDDNKKITFNAVCNGYRQILIADLEGVGRDVYESTQKGN